MGNNGWIGVDLDGTIAVYEGWRGPHHIGEPIVLMVNRVREWLVRGVEVRIFTARVSHDGTLRRMEEAQHSRVAIEKWCEEHIGQILKITNEKDYAMLELWDDRAIRVEQNTGKVI